MAGIRVRARIPSPVWVLRRLSGKARGLRILPVWKERATPPDRMDRRPKGGRYSCANSTIIRDSLHLGETRLPCGKGAFSNQHGATYLMLMFIIVLLGITLMAVSQHSSVIMKRDREAELAFRGNRIKEAIERYVADYEVQKATRANRYPLKLEDLTKRPKRYLQVVYKDPFSGEDFALIKVGKDIRGVRSTSMDEPMDLMTFKGASTYNSIRFEASAVGCGSNPANPAVPINCQQPTSSGGSEEKEEEEGEEPE